MTHPLPTRLSSDLGKRFKPAPGKADAEQFQPVDQRGGRGPVLSLQDKAEKAGRAVEVARPKLMAGAGGKGRVQHARDLRLLGEPFGHLAGARVMLGEARTEEQTSELQSLKRR